MDLARELAADLRDLAVDLSADGYTRTTVAMIEHNLRRSVASVLGASITLRTPSSPETPVTVNFVSRTIDVGEITSALLVALPGLSGPRTAGITFYAGERDAFVRLRPPLAAALQLDPAELALCPPLPTAPVAPMVDGLQDFSLVNRAVGVLLNRGYSLVEAREELTSLARRTGTDLAAAARKLLDSAHYG